WTPEAGAPRRCVLADPLEKWSSTRTSMTLGAATLASRIECPSCKGPVDVKSRHVMIDGTAVRVYCSDACLRARDAQPAAPPIETTRRRAHWWLVGGIVAGTTGFVLWYANVEGDDEPSGASPISSFVA